MESEAFDGVSSFSSLLQEFHCTLTSLMMILCVLCVFQAPPVEQTLPIRSPLPFPGPVVLSPTSMPPGGAPFIHAENMQTKGETF